MDPDASIATAIRNEIKNSREQMIEALYPIVGRLVSAAVATAFREVVASLEQRINAQGSPGSDGKVRITYTPKDDAVEGTEQQDADAPAENDEGQPEDGG